MAIKLTAFFAMLTISVALVSSTVTQYDKAALTCIADYKVCVLGKTSACRTCIKSCGNVGISTTQPKDEICTLLQIYCQYYESKAPPRDCLEPTCIAQLNRCTKFGDCSSCTSACKTCPKQYQKCSGGEKPRPSRVQCPGTCTYYRPLCVFDEAGGSKNINCNKCFATCNGIRGCEDNARYCKAGQVSI